MKNLTLYIVFILFPLTGIMAQICPDTVKLSLETNFEGPDFTVDINVENYKDIVGFQFALSYDKDLLGLKFVTSSINGFGSDNFMNHDEGLISFFWLGNPNGESLPDQTKLITLKFTSMQVSSFGYLAISDKQSPYEFVNNDSETLCIKGDIIEFGSKGFDISGKVMYDKVGNCLFNLPISGLANWLVELNADGKKYYRNTLADGSYKFTMPSGVYSVRAIPRNKYWQVCDDIISVIVSNEDVPFQDFLAKEVLPCAKIKTDISAKALKRCADNTYYLLYENQGTEKAENVTIAVEYDDDYMEFKGANFPLFALEKDKVTFDIGTLEIGDIDTIKLVLNLRCDNTIDNQTHCVTASAYPNDPCVVPPDWSGSKLEVEAECDKNNDKVRFSVINNGIGKMKNTTSYIVTEDEVMRPPKPIQLDLLEALVLEFPANGSTYRIFATQESEFPYASPIATIALEGCGDDGTGNFSTGFVSLFEESDRDLFIDTDCQQSNGLTAENSMVGFPVGYGDEHYIEKGTNIEYIIRFNNTTDDTASNIIIKSLIPNTLDISSLQLGSSSHHYTYRFNQERELIIRFDSIMLPKNETNDPVFSGFIKYKIKPSDILENGDSIKTFVRISYDFGPPVLYNKVFHIIGTNFIISGTDWFEKPLDIKIYPNPVSSELMIDTKDEVFKSGRYEIFSSLGNYISEGKIVMGNQQIQFEFLPEGLYYIKLIFENRPVAAIKVIKL